MSLPIRNDTPTQLRDLGSNLNVGNNFAVNKFGQQQVVLVAGDTPGATPVKAEDSTHVSGDAGDFVLAVRNDALANFTNTDLDYTPFGVTAQGALYVVIDRALQGSQARGLLKNEDDPAGSGDAGVSILGKILAIPASQAGDGDYGHILLNDLNAQYFDGVRRNTVTHTQPSVTNTTSFTLVAANTARRYMFIQNNSAANIMINLNNGTLTGIVPTATNLGIVIVPGGNYETPPNAVPTAAITCFQSSGGTINTVSVMEQS